MTYGSLAVQLYSSRFATDHPSVDEHGDNPRRSQALQPHRVATWSSAQGFAAAVAKLQGSANQSRLLLISLMRPTPVRRKSPSSKAQHLSCRHILKCMTKAPQPRQCTICWSTSVQKRNLTRHQHHQTPANHLHFVKTDQKHRNQRTDNRKTRGTDS